jgi:hypothetical protein
MERKGRGFGATIFFFTFTVLSQLLLAKSGAVGWDATDATQQMCPSRVATQVADELLEPEDSSHNLTVLSRLPVARSAPAPLG